MILLVMGIRSVGILKLRVQVKLEKLILVMLFSNLAGGCQAFELCGQTVKVISYPSCCNSLILLVCLSVVPREDTFRDSCLSRLTVGVLQLLLLEVDDAKLPS